MIDDRQKDIFSKNLKRLLEIHGLSQAEVAKSIKVSPQTFNTWVQGIALPRMGKVQALADYFGIAKSDLIEENQPQELSKSKGVKIPVLGRVAAGVPIEAIEEILDWEEIPESMARNGEYFALKIRGDSMEPRIQDGDVVIVRRQPDADSQDIVIALVNGEDATCKRLIKYDHGLGLLSNNPLYDPLIFSHKEAEEMPVTILGKVVELRGKF